MVEGKYGQDQSILLKIIYVFESMSAGESARWNNGHLIVHTAYTSDSIFLSWSQVQIAESLNALSERPS